MEADVFMAIISVQVGRATRARTARCQVA